MDLSTGNSANPSNPLKICVNFRRMDNIMSKGFIIELAKDQSYDEITKAVADHIGLDDPSHIKLTSHNVFSDRPKSFYIKDEKNLGDMLITCDKTSDILYYEVLDIPLSEFERLNTLSVPVLFNCVKEDEVPICFVKVMFPKESTAKDVIDEIKRKVKLKNPIAEFAEFRLLEISGHRITKIFRLNEKIGKVRKDYVRLRADEIPEEEKQLGPSKLLVRVFHFTKEDVEYEYQTHLFGHPFLLVIREGEKMADVKNQIQKKLQVADDEFCEWKFSVLKVGGLKCIGDDDIVSSHFEEATVRPWILGIEHSAYRRHTWSFPILI